MERYQDFTDGKTFWEKVRWCKNQSQSSSLWHRPFQCRNTALLFHLTVCMKVTEEEQVGRFRSTSDPPAEVVTGLIRGESTPVWMEKPPAFTVNEQKTKQILHSSDKRDMSPQSNATRPNNSNVLVGYVFGDLWEKKCWIYTRKSGRHPSCHTDSSSYIHPRKQRLSPMNQQTQQSSIFLPVGSKQVIR